MVWGFAGVLFSVQFSPVSAQSGSAAGLDNPPLAALFPADTTVFLQVREPKILLADILDHPVLQAFLESKPGRQMMLSPQYFQLAAGLAVIEGQAGMPWRELASKVTGRGIALAANLERGDFVLVSRSEDEAVLRKTIGSILAFVENQSKQAGQAVPFRLEESAGGRLAVFEQFALGRLGADLVIANSRHQVTAAFERLAQAGRSDQQELAGCGPFRAAASLSNAADDIWVYVNLDQVRERGLARELFAGMADNPGAELIAGGILETLKESGWAASGLRLDRAGLSVGLAAEHDPARVGPARSYFFGPQGQGEAPAFVGGEGMLGNLSAWRDLSAWWLAKDELFDDSVVAGLVQADSQISTVFSGLDFGGEVLGSLQPGLQIVVARQVWSEEKNPGIKLPAFALTGRLKAPEQMGRRFKVAFQSVMGFVNLGLSQQGQPQFDVDTLNTETGCVCASRVFPEPDAPRDLVVYNFSPTLIVQGEQLILASTTELATRIGELADSGPVAGRDSGAPETEPGSNRPATAGNTVAHVDLEALTAVLVENREGLIAQNMLENGNSRKKAESDVDAALLLAGFLKSLDARLGVGTGHLAFDVGVSFQPDR